MRNDERPSSDKLFYYDLHSHVWKEIRKHPNEEWPAARFDHSASVGGDLMCIYPPFSLSRSLSLALYPPP